MLLSWCRTWLAALIVLREKHVPRTGLLFVVLFGLSACGFHLRGSSPDSGPLNAAEDTAFSAVFIKAHERYGDLLRDAHEAVAATRLHAVDTAESADLILDLRSDKLTRRVQTVDQYGRPSDYELIYAITYAIAAPDAVAKVESHVISARREYSFNSQDLLGKGEEEILLVGEMRRELVQRLLQQVRYVATQRKHS